MRILMLSQYYAPEPAAMVVDLARGLRERGHQVQVITGFPCYPEGRTYDGYRQRLYDESYSDGVLVTRVPQFPDHSRSAVRRALYYLAFAWSAATIGLWRARRADVIWVYQSAFPIGLAAWLISRVRRVPYVLDVVDLWPESVAASGAQNRLVLSAIRRLVKFIYRGARRINVITHGYWANLRGLGVPESKLALIHCWAPDDRHAPEPYNEELAQAEGLAGRFNVMYAGTMGPVQDLKTVIAAAALLDDLPAVQFVMVGNGTERAALERQAAERGTDRVRFLGRRPVEELRRLVPMANALLVHLKPDPMCRISIPSKTLTSMASGRPILMAVEGEASELVEEHGCGVVAAPSNPAALADAVRRLARMPAERREELGRAGLRAYRLHFRSELQFDRFESLLQEAVGMPGRRHSKRAA